jgi:hypothetical protein
VSARAVRRLVIGVCAGGIVGMIITSVLNHNGAALTFGLITAVAILCLMVATAVTGGAVTAGGAADVERQAGRVEAAVAGLVQAGADETSVRDLVRDAVRLGRARAVTTGPDSGASKSLPPL